MEVYSLQEAARKTKIGVETLKRACEQGYIKAVRLPGGQIRVTEDALAAALNQGIELPSPSKAGRKGEQPKGLKAYAERRRRGKTSA